MSDWIKLGVYYVNLGAVTSVKEMAGGTYVWFVDGRKMCFLGEMSEKLLRALYIRTGGGG